MGKGKHRRYGKKKRGLFIGILAVIIIIVILLGLYFTGIINFSGNGTKGPETISLNGYEIEYGLSMGKMEELFGEGYETETIMGLPGYEYSDGIEVIYNADNQVRVLIVRNPHITTFKNIRVGDSISSVKRKLKKEQNLADVVYFTAFDGTKEKEITGEEQPDDWICLNYQVNEDKTVAAIVIYDMAYGRTSE